MTEETLNDAGLLTENAVVLGIDGAVLGYTDPGILVYSYQKLIDHFVEEQEMDIGVAYEWVDFNVLPLASYRDGFVLVYGMREE
mgnify:CR=1 FL=1